MRARYLNVEDILVIHALIIDETGGSHGVRDLHLLHSLVKRPRASFGGKEMYPSIVQKAAAYLEALAQYHVFVDGNKRTAVAVTARFLHLHGFVLTASNREVVEFILQDVIAKKYSLERVAQWLGKHTKQIHGKTKN